jgi:Arc/MetJ-type ribon-helix-helix transcriptional regulator
MRNTKEYAQFSRLCGLSAHQLRETTHRSLREEPHADSAPAAERGPYESADEFVAQAVRLLHAEEQWLADNRVDIAAKIERGFAQAERGELVDGEEAFRQLRQRHDQHRTRP